jgi:hypothetical protein
MKLYVIYAKNTIGCSQYLNSAIIEVESAQLSEEDISIIEQAILEEVSNENVFSVTVLNWKELAA